MTLKPSLITPASMKSLKPRNAPNAVEKCMVIDCKNDIQWRAIHDPIVNGVVLRRRPIRAIESFFQTALDDIYLSTSFKCAQSALRTQLNKHLVLENPDDDLRRKFLVNDIANWMRVLIQQSRSRDFLVRINPDLSSDFTSGPEALKLLVTYRGLNITFRQPKDKDERTFSPYGVALFRGQGYTPPVEWKADRTEEKPFYLTIEPFQRGMTL